MLQRLTVRNFRNHNEGVFDFANKSTIIVGKNGTGKTSLLEAIYISYRGTSFKGYDRDIVRETADWYRIDAVVDDIERTVKYIADSNGVMKKSFTIDSKVVYRLSQKNKLPIVLFSPNDLQLLSGSPSRRRKYIDTLISQLDNKYAITIRKYEQALMQRNKLLKSPNCTPDNIFPWNVILSETGSYIIHARNNISEKINNLLTSKYNTIANSSDDLKFTYSSANHSSQYILAEYESSYEKDEIVGTTTYGPHRHDIVIEMNGKNARDVASRGENRTIVLALKSIETDLLLDNYDTKPLILLDDVYGELDESRQQLVDKVFDDMQVIITSTHPVLGNNKTIEI